MPIAESKNEIYISKITTNTKSTSKLQKTIKPNIGTYNSKKDVKKYRKN